MEQFLYGISILENEDNSIHIQANALTDIRRQLESSIPNLSEKQLLKVLIRLYHLVEKEKSHYGRAKPSMKGRHHDHLAQLGQVIVDTLARTLESIKFRVIRQFIEHMLRVLPCGKEILLIPVKNMYLRLLHLILCKHQHLAHLDQDLWYQCVVFASSTLEGYLSLVHQHEVTQQKFRASSAGLSIDWLSSCLACLSSWSAARFTVSIAERLVRVVRSNLNHGKRIQRIQSSVFSTMKNMLANFAPSNMCHARALSSLVFEALPTWWLTKNPQVKKELLACLMLAIPFLQVPLVRCSISDEDIRDITQYLFIDFFSRHEMLDTTKLYLLSQTSIASKSISLARSIQCTLNSENEAVEEFWYILQNLAHLLCSNELSLENTGKDLKQTKKRIRMTSLQDCLYDNLGSSDTVVLKQALQILLMTYELGYTDFITTRILERLQSLLDQSDFELLNWVNLCLSSLLYNLKWRQIYQPKTVENLKFDGDRLWSTAIAGLSIAATSRTSCYLATTLLLNTRVTEDRVCKYVRSLVDRVGNSSPCVLDDAACTFLLCILDRSLQANHLNSKQASKIASDYFSAQVRSIRMSDLLFINCAAVTQFSSLSCNRGLPRGSETTRKRFLRGGILSVTSKDVEQNEYIYMALRGEFGQILGERDAIARTTDCPSSKHKLPEFHCVFDDALMIRVEGVQNIINSDVKSSTVHKESIWEAIFLVIVFSRCARSPQFVAHSQKIDHLVTLILSVVDGLKLEEEDYVVLTSIVAILLEDEQTVLLPSESDIVPSHLRLLISLQNQAIEHLRAQSTHSVLNHSQQDLMLYEGQAIRQACNEACINFCLLTIILRTAQSQHSVEGWEAIVIALFHFEDPKVVLESPVFPLLWTHIPVQVAGVSVSWSKLLEFFTTNIVQNYRYERSEPLHLFLIQIVQDTIRLSDRVDRGISESWVRQILNWLVQLSLATPSSSYAVRLQMVHLLSRITCNTVPKSEKFGPFENPALLKYLFQCLQDDDLRVALTAGTAMSSVFEQFETHLHTRLYQDIAEGLKADSALAERYILKTVILASLGSTVESIRHLAIIGLINTDQNEVLESHVHQAIHFVADRLDISRPVLLQRFQRTTFRAWILMDQDITRFPFRLFGLDNSAFIEFFSDEIAVQSFLKASDLEFTRVCNYLNKPVIKTIQNNLCLIRVYHDILSKQTDSEIPVRINALLEYYISAGVTDSRNFGWDLRFELLCSDYENINFTAPEFLGSTTSRYEAILEFLGPSSKSEQIQELQYSWKTFIGSIAPHFSSLRARDLVSILQKLFGQLWQLIQGPGFPMGTRRIVRKIALLVAFYHELQVKGYILDRVLQGLSSVISASTDFRTQDLANKLLQYIFMNVTKQHLDRPSISIALLFMADFARSHDIEFAPSFNDWLHRIKANASSGQRAMIEIVASVNSDAKMEISVLISSIEYASELLRTDQSCADTRGRAKFLGLLTGVVTLEMLKHSELVRTLNSFFHCRNIVCTSSDQLTLLSRIEGALLLHCPGLSLKSQEAEHNDVRDVATPLDPFDAISLCHNIELSLSNYNMDIVNAAENVLGQMLRDKLPDIIPYIATDVLQSLPLYSFEASKTFTSTLKDDTLLESILSTETNSAEWTTSLLRFLLIYFSGRKSAQHMCQMSSNDLGFATLSIPILATSALRNSFHKKDDFNSTLSRIIRESLSSPAISRERISICIDILQYLRLTYWKIAKGVDAAVILSRLEVDYLQAAIAAEHFLYNEDALLFLQLFWSQADSPNLVIHEETIHTLRKIIYKRLPDPDSFYGVPASPSIASSIALAEHEQDNVKLLQLSSAVARSVRQINRSIYPFMEIIMEDSLLELGNQSYNLPSQFFVSREVSEARFRAALKMRQWNLPFPQGQPRGAYECLYRAHIQLTRVEETNTQMHHGLKQAICDAHVALQTLSPAPDPRLRSVVAGCLLEMEEILQNTRIPEDTYFLKTMLSRTLRMVETLSTSDYDTILTCRHTTLDYQHTITSKRPLRLSDWQIDLLLRDYSVVAEIGDFETVLPIAALCEHLIITQDLSDHCADTKARAQALISQILWQTGEQSASVQLLTQAINNENNAEHPTALSTATNLLNIGLRSAAAKLRNPHDILNLYLIRAIETLQRAANMTAGPLYLKFALFCDTQLQSLSKTEDFESVDLLRAQKVRDIAVLDDLIKKTQSVAKKQEYKLQRAKIQALLLEDKQEIENLARVKTSYLCRSIVGFLQAFALTEDGNIHMSRCTTLWFAHSHDDEATQAFELNWNKVPSHKYLLLLDQFLARLTSVKSQFQDTLHALIERLVTEHPYHTLYSIYAIQCTTKFSDISAIQRQKVVTKITQRATETIGSSALMESVSKLCSNYVKFATMQLDKREFAARTVPISVYPSYKVFTIESASWCLPPLTMRILPRASRDYSDIPRITTYGDYFQLAGGISMPKILTCRLTDGTTCKELVKAGHDDLRQDAVMQRVFSQVDGLFRLHRVTRQRQLNVRTYKVLSLTPNAGVLEWVKETIPLQDLLQPLHERYHVGDWSYSKCRKRIAEASKSSRSTRLSTYQETTLNCKPVMYHAFIDNFSDALSWYSAQLAYSRSTAVISIVGHVLGLGDRHLHNILFDKSKGEVVHIDLGIAFDQGKLLPIPETVPFRMTRDIVSGMGISGVEGVFRRCCEFTLDVMRKEKRSINAVLDVLRYDPLYNWISPAIRAGKVQNNTLLCGTSKPSVPEIGSEATRALLSVERKLVSDLSVSAVVNGLIMTASDPQNLAVLFAGWSAWY